MLDQNIEGKGRNSRLFKGNIPKPSSKCTCFRTLRSYSHLLVTYFILVHRFNSDSQNYPVHYDDSIWYSYSL